jgi:L-alanine-DL-glutamate epimerase-like enolase superfamily enzyme
MTKITGVTPFAVAYPEPNDNDQTRHLVFVRIETADGTVGWGEAITQFPPASRATVRLVEDLAEPIVGRDPTANVEIWRALRQQTWWYSYRGGLASFALAAIDIALWDLKGKLLGQPLVELLGGAHREQLPVIASTHAFDASIHAEAERHGRYVRELGYQGVKVGMGKSGRARLGYEFGRDVEFVALLREAIGPDAMLVIDRGQSLQWTVADAIRRTNAFEEHGLAWIEEPLEPGDVRGFKVLRQHCKTLIGTGEREWDAGGFRSIAESGIADVIGCDVGRAQGITGVLEVIATIEAHGLWFNSHAWSSAVNTAASIALSAITPRCLVQELKPDPNPMQHELVERPFVTVGGFVAVPRDPGLGVEPREDVLRRYAYT